VLEGVWDIALVSLMYRFNQTKPEIYMVYLCFHCFRGITTFRDTFVMAVLYRARFVLSKHISLRSYPLKSAMSLLSSGWFNIWSWLWHVRFSFWLNDRVPTFSIILIIQCLWQFQEHMLCQLRTCMENCLNPSTSISTVAEAKVWPTSGNGQ
jgi:hypothetical protein